ncbi:MAG: hybrid sensor histidine kinase/response regulator [Bacteroidales bacterium]|nr:hybrid sensor histidine kinase/response regulator [Bacteroidales bacterium]
MKTILIIDDNNKNLQVLGSILNDANYKIAMAKDGKSGLKLAKKIMPDAILLDIMMPDMDGYEVCEKLKKDEKSKEIPVLFITAKAETEDIVKGFEKGGVDYITKPFNKEELLVRLKTHIELKKAKELITIQAKDLYELNEAKNKMFSVIAHDLKNAIGGFKSASNMLAEDIESFTQEEVMEFIKVLRDSSNATYDLLENMLLWAKSHISEIKPQFRKILIKEIAESVIDLYKSQAEKKHINILMNIPNHLFAFSDIETIKIVFRNLISNAIKFTPENGSITIDAKETGDYITIFVKDTGVGIAQEDIEKIFDDKKHFTTYGTDSEKGSGIGMGLCKHYIEANGGQINIESTPRKGTTVKFTLKKAKP